MTTNITIQPYPARWLDKTNTHLESIIMIKKALFAGLVASTMAMTAHAATGFYAGVGAGIGGMNTNDFSSDDNPYSNTSLRSGVTGRLALGYLTGEGNFNYGFELG